MVDLSQDSVKAPASSMNGGCVEVAQRLPGVIAVRDKMLWALTIPDGDDAGKVVATSTQPPFMELARAFRHAAETGQPSLLQLLG